MEVVVAISCIGGETFEAREEIRKGGRRDNGKCRLASSSIAIVRTTEVRTIESRLPPMPRLVLARLTLVVMLLEEERICS